MALKMQDGRPEMDDSEETEEEISVGKKKPPIKMIICIVLLLVFIGVGVKSFITWRHHHKPKVVPVIEKVGETVPLDEFMMNLADPGGEHYIKMTLALGLKEGVTGDKFKDQVPACRDAIVMVLSAKKLADINTVPGKMELKQEIQDAVNKTVGERDVIRVYYQAFATQ
jgi:flagellar FliL protein